MTQSKWNNGTVLHYCFFTNGKYSVPKVQADAVRDAFAKWKAVGIGLSFQEVQKLAEAEVRIGYSTKEGASQSAVGRDVLTVPLSEPTTQYGWDLTSPYGRGTALHELGHVLGMEHEHQSPFAGITWNDVAVYRDLGGPPNNWPRSVTYQNILQKLSAQQVQGSTWDPDSIMEYEFGPGLIEKPDQYQNGLTPPGTLSASDKSWVVKWYPAMAKKLSTLQPLKLASADQQVGVNIIKRAIEEPLRWITQNAGKEGSIIVQQVKDAKEVEFGYNAATETFENLVAAGVIDPTKVVRTALQNASSIASLLLTTEALVCDIPEEKPAAGAGGPGGPGGGMGGMY